MKKIIPISILVLILAVLLPILISAISQSDSEPSSDQTAQDTEASSAESQSPQTDDKSSITLDTDADCLDKSLTITVSIDGQVVELSMFDYLRGVISAEMPITFEHEALKAQAVAARTYTLYKKLISPSTTHPDSDVCGDYNCCKAYTSDDALREKWGDDYETNMATIISAITETDGQTLTYENEPILAVFHSSSSGNTEASADIWGGEMPYLQSVKTFEDGDTVPNYFTSVQMTLDEFKSTFTAAYPQASFTSPDPQSWIADVARSDSGRITALTVAGVTISGSDFRTVFSLRSTSINFEYGDGSITLTTQGFGHGVGMSQYGANYLASMGLGYADILSWYYTGVAMVTFDQII